MSSLEESRVILSGLLSFKDEGTLGSEAVVKAFSGVVTGAPIRMLSRKLSMMDSFDLISSSTSISNFVLLNELIIVSPLKALDPFSSDEELVRRLSMVILKLNMLSRKPSITFSLSFKCFIFRDMGLFAEDCNLLCNDETFESSLLMLTRLTF